MTGPIQIKMSLHEDSPLSMKLVDITESCNVKLDVKINKITADYYEGQYVITPSSEKQVFSTKYLTMADDFTVNPIPSNYGLITWNGSTLLVS